MTNIDRGHIGVLPRTPRLEDESYLQFMESFRNLAIRGVFPPIMALAEQAEAAGRSPDESPYVRAWKRMMRSQQQQTWQKLQESYHADQARWEAELDAAEQARPGRLHYDPGFITPKYASLDIHLQPGGYVGDPLAGYVFHHGTKVFYQGDNDQDELHRMVVDHVRAPDDGRVLKVLDLGCSIGQCTTALKQRFPDAEVTGLDVALPLVRYAHKRATDLGVDVHFMQGLAEDVKLPSGQYDVILAYILFHEVPERLFTQILSEVHRLLRPGGTFTVVDAPNDTHLPAGNRLWLRFDARYNCEPYSPAFVASDFPRLIEQSGLRVTSRGPTPTFLSCTTAVKDARGS
jgi:2-polyprenyl-3-methyl-5-hydroxy-6-metoxy-1,4-benzoquinol methylase